MVDVAELFGPARADVNSAKEGDGNEDDGDHKLSRSDRRPVVRAVDCNLNLERIKWVTTSVALQLPKGLRPTIVDADIGCVVVGSFINTCLVVA